MEGLESFSDIRMRLSRDDIFIDEEVMKLAGLDEDERADKRAELEMQLDAGFATGNWDGGYPILSQRGHTRGPNGERYSLLGFESPRNSGDAERELREQIRAGHRETFGTGRLRTRWKRCYEIAGVAMIVKQAPPEGTVLVHGVEQNRYYAWLELPDGRLWDPVTCEFDTLRPQYVAARYTPREAARKLRETGYWGWWSETGIIRRLHDGELPYLES
jgi:hypothetical protein